MYKATDTKKHNMPCSRLLKIERQAVRHFFIGNAE